MEFLSTTQFRQPTIKEVIGTLVVAFFLYQALSTIFTIYFGRLAAFPGPLLARGTRLWYVYHLLKGRLPFAVQAAHEKYGRIVRIAPDELSFADPDAWKSIYGYNTGANGGEMLKDPGQYNNTSGAEYSIFAAPSDRHRNLRRLLSHGFSEKALRSQEVIIQDYLDLFIRRLRDLSATGQTIDIVTWYNFFTFDVIGDLGFAEPFNCLRDSKYHPWIDLLFAIFPTQQYMRAVDYYPTLKPLLSLFIPKRFLEAFATHGQFVEKKAMHRFTMKTDRLDLMSKMAAPESGLTDKDFIASSDVILVGGSETTATLLSGLTYLLLKHPRALQKLVDEIRTKFQSEEEIDYNTVNSLEYMLACIDEAFRLYPPIPGALLRKTTEGAAICGKFVPPGTIVGIYHWVMFRFPEYFKDPEEYIPERHLEDERFKDDNRGVLQPFSYGPRNCIGRNLAYFEMRLALARLLFNFDIESTPEIEGWMDQNIFLLWQKKPLPVKLKSRDVPLRKQVIKLAKNDPAQA